MSTRIDLEKVTLWDKLKPSYELCKSCMIRKQYKTLSRIINQVNLFQHTIQKYELSYHDIAKDGKIMRILGEA